MSSWDEKESTAQGVFGTTHWSVVLAAGHNAAPGGQEALENLCRAYWHPPFFHELRPFVWGQNSGLTQAEVAGRLGMSENGVAQAVHRLRKRYGELLRLEVASTVAPADVEDELRHLLRAVST